MALGTTAALLMAGGAFTATTQIGAANTQAKAIQRQASYNAEIYDQQAGMIQEQKKLREYQFNREAGFARGTLVNRAAGKGLLLSGSPLAIMIDNETQMQFDKAISDYNSDIETNYVRSQAQYTRDTGAQQARAARFSGYSDAFKTLLTTGAQVGMMSLGTSSPRSKGLPSRGHIG